MSNCANAVIIGLDGRRRVRVCYWGDVNEEMLPTPLRLDVLLSTQ